MTDEPAGEVVTTLRVTSGIAETVLVVSGERLTCRGEETPPHPCAIETLWEPEPGLSGGPEPVRRRAGEAGAVSHAADRLAKAIVLGMRSPRDPRNLAAWGKAVGVSRGALRAWCGAAGVTARSCLDFLRVLRALQVSRALGWELRGALDVVDRRSLAQLLERGGLRNLFDEGLPTVAEFLTVQQYLTRESLTRAIHRRLQDSPRPPR